MLAIMNSSFVGGWVGLRSGFVRGQMLLELWITYEVVCNRVNAGIYKKLKDSSFYVHFFTSVDFFERSMHRVVLSFFSWIYVFRSACVSAWFKVEMGSAAYCER